TKARTPPDTAASRRFNVPVTLVSTKSWRECVATCGLCSVAACSTCVTPNMHSETTPRSTIEPTTSVNGERWISTLTTGVFCARSVRTKASPRWPALPVTRILVTVELPGLLFHGFLRRAVPRDLDGTCHRHQLRDQGVGFRERHRARVQA